MSSVIDEIRQVQCLAAADPAVSCSRSGGRQRRNSGHQVFVETSTQTYSLSEEGFGYNYGRLKISASNASRENTLLRYGKIPKLTSAFAATVIDGRGLLDQADALCHRLTDYSNTVALLRVSIYSLSIV